MKNVLQLSDHYCSAIDTLERRIEALVVSHPEILKFTSVYDLRSIKDFRHDDIGPTGAQVAEALSRVINRKR